MQLAFLICIKLNCTVWNHIPSLYTERPVINFWLLSYILRKNNLNLRKWVEVTISITHEVYKKASADSEYNQDA